MKSRTALQSDAARIWSAALAAVDPEVAVRGFMSRRGDKLRVGDHQIDLSRIRRVWAVGAGKASAPMGRAVERILGRKLSGGVLVTKYGHELPLRRIEVLQAGHPLPDGNGLAAAQRIVTLPREQVGKGDLVLSLLSGGGSALLVSPAPGIRLEDKLECTRLLLNAGATIHEMNAIRKHLSADKGGELARMLAHARVITLTLSDVVGDDLDTIASGPLVPDTTTFADCLEILERLEVADKVPPAAKRRRAVPR